MEEQGSEKTTVYVYVQSHWETKATVVCSQPQYLEHLFRHHELGLKVAPTEVKWSNQVELPLAESPVNQKGNHVNNVPHQVQVEE